MPPAAAPRARSPKPVETHGALRLAAIDVGSNSIHMIVAQADHDGGVTTLWRLKEPVGLGRASFPSRKLTPEAMDRAINTLARFKQAATQRQCEKIVAIATSAIREAENGGEFIERARRELKLFIRVVSAREEARLIYLGVRHAMPLKNQPHLIVDVGGGSVEFIVGDSQRAVLLESRKLGAARLTARFVQSDPITAEERRAVVRHLRQELTPLFAEIETAHPVRVIGTSGTLENLAAMCGTLHEPDDHGVIGVIDRKPFQKMLARLLKMNSEQRAQVRGLDDGRKDQIIAGALLIDEVFSNLDLKRMVVGSGALREGILVDYLARHLPDLEIRRDVPDPRRRSVIDLARRCDWHKTHSEQVARLTLSLFDQLKPLHGMNGTERELIEYGALLHDIGWHIGRNGHHKHSMYLILHGDLKNFTPEEVGIIANIARYHRKTPPMKRHERYMELLPESRRIVDVGASLLRIADGLDRSHAGVVKSVKCRLGGSQVELKVVAGSDAELEVWGAQRKTDLFEKTFGKSLKILHGKR